MKINISYEKNPKRNDINHLWQGIMTYATEMKNHEPHESFAFFIRDENYQIKGGVNGYIFYGCLTIDQLWIDRDMRGQGYGKELVSLSENLGKENNCLFAAVNTMDWEALDFYKKIGYKVEFQRHGFLKDSIFYFLRKDF